MVQPVCYFKNCETIAEGVRMKGVVWITKAPLFFSALPPPSHQHHLHHQHVPLPRPLLKKTSVCTCMHSSKLSQCSVHNCLLDFLNIWCFLNRIYGIYLHPLSKVANTLSADNLLVVLDDHDCSFCSLMARVSNVDIFAGCRSRPTLWRMYLTFRSCAFHLW